MRKYAILREPLPMNDYGDFLVKIMIHTIKNQGVYVYLYTAVDEYGQGCADYWFEDLEDAEEYALSCGVKPGDWVLIDDPLPDCQHDTIHPIRVKGRNIGKPIWGEFEIFNGTEWVDFVYGKHAK